MKPTRHQKDTAIARTPLSSVIEKYGLTAEESRVMQSMDKNDQELADYHGFPEIQAQILKDRADEKSATEEANEQAIYAMGALVTEITVDPVARLHRAA